MYGAKASSSGTESTNADEVPCVVLKETADELCVRPVCSQCSNVLVAGGLSVGMSRSIINTANDVPSSLLCVAIVGAVCVANRSLVTTHSPVFDPMLGLTIFRDHRTIQRRDISKRDQKTRLASRFEPGGCRG